MRSGSVGVFAFIVINPATFKWRYRLVESDVVDEISVFASRVDSVFRIFPFVGVNTFLHGIFSVAPVGNACSDGFLNSVDIEITVVEELFAR